MVTPRSLAPFHGETLILPDVRILDDTEKSALRAYVAAGNTLIVNGADVSGLAESPNVVRFNDDPGKAYMAAAEHDLGHTTPDPQAKFLASLKNRSKISVDAPTGAISNIAEVDGKECVFIANFQGLRGHEKPVQDPVNVSVRFSGQRKNTLKFLPFLGEAQEIHGKLEAGNSTFVLPAIEKGAVACLEAP